MNKTIEVTFDKESYKKIIQYSLLDIALVNPRFIPLNGGIEIFICKNNEVFVPYSSTLKNKVNVTKEIVELSKNREYVLFTDKNKIIGTDKEVFMKSYSHPRGKAYLWVIADRTEKGIFWHKQYNSSAAFAKAVAKYFLLQKEKISHPLKITRMGTSLYLQLMRSLFDSIYLKEEDVRDQMLVSPGDSRTLFSTYRVKKLLQEVI